MARKNSDPAFLFYSSDFLVGIMFMSNEQVGKYIKLLCLQHQKGRLTEKQVMGICDIKDVEVLCKFYVDKKGNYFNERLEKEVEKRLKYTQSRRKNLAGKGSKGVSHKVSHMDTHKVAHMENENENENEDANKDANKNVNANEKSNTYSEVIDYLNLINGSKYKVNPTHKKHISARINEGNTLEDFKTVIDKKYKSWHGTEWEKFLRPQTLFGTNFDSYLNEKETTKPKEVIEDGKYADCYDD